MGNREQLLAAAKRCLLGKGYARTSVRDIATAAGVSMAAIGYHYGTREALLGIALMELAGEWGEELQRVLSTSARQGAQPLERFEALWDAVLNSFAARRQMWAAQLDIMTQVDHVPQVREQLSAGLADGRLGLARILHDSDEIPDDDEARAVGSFYLALLDGLLIQWLIDPDNAPTGADMAKALSRVSGRDSRKPRQ